LYFTPFLNLLFDLPAQPYERRLVGELNVELFSSKRSDRFPLLVPGLATNSMMPRSEFFEDFRVARQEHGVKALKSRS
jgi:hypothetical protein